MMGRPPVQKKRRKLLGAKFTVDEMKSVERFATVQQLTKAEVVRLALRKLGVDVKAS